MVPVYLSFEAFGPYLEKQEIDFKKLQAEGLFLISGQTGAGKTAILDAITYALFGRSSGDVRGDIAGMRSDYAPEEVETKVEFVFSSNNNEYKFEKSVSIHEKRNGEREYRISQNAFYRDGDGRFVPFFENPKITNVRQKAEEILGLTYDQFCQVILLPQGQFERLLVSDSAEKEKILVTLFHAEKWEAITTWLCDAANEMKRKNEERQAGIDGILSQYGCEGLEDLEALKEDAKAGLVSAKENCMALLKREEALQAEVKEAEALQALLLERDGVEKRLAGLKAQEGDIAGVEAALRRADNVQKVQPLRTIAAQRQKEKEERDGQYEAARRAVGEQEAAKEAAIKRLLELQLYLVEREKELRNLAKKQEGEHEEAEAAYRELWRKYMQNAAWLLSEELEEGEPCPVCGSRHHAMKPDKVDAVGSGEIKNAEGLLEKQRKQMEHCGNEIAAVVEKRNSIKGVLINIESENINLNAKNHTDVAWLIAEVKVAEQNFAASIEAEKNALEERTAASAKCEEALQEYKALCAELGFETDEQVRQSHMTEEEVKQKKEAVGNYRAALYAAVEREKEVARKLAGKNEPGMDRIRKELLTAKEKRQLADTEYAGQKAKAELLEDAYGKVEKIWLELREQRKEAAELDSFARLLRGDQGVGLKRYVLGVMLSMIAQEANRLLKDVHGGRYELFRITEGVGRARKVGLGLEVFDRNTGERRHVNGLSGGEKFLVSLALSLGLSAVVQAQSGGTRIDAMFIDEGFGSLDPDSIEDALHILSSIYGSTRLVGIISHVQMLKESINARIEVEKTRWGSSLRVTV